MLPLPAPSAAVVIVTVFNVLRPATDSLIVKFFAVAPVNPVVFAAEVIEVVPFAALRQNLNVAEPGSVFKPVYSAAFVCTNKLSAGMFTPPPARSSA